MSHFAVLVTETDKDYNDVEKQLAPFDEERRMPLHIRKTKAQLIQEGREECLKARDKFNKWSRDPVAYEAGCSNPSHIKWLKDEVPELIKALETNDEEVFYKQGTSWYDEEDLDKDGNYITQRNDDAKWDWYEVGGRWGGSFINKAGEYVDIVRVGDIDWEAMNAETRKERAKAWAAEQKKPIEDRWRWKARRDELLLMSKVQYVNQPVEQFCTFAILHRGVWYERGKMGWFAMVKDEKDKGTWEDEWQRLIDSLDKNTEVTMVDCHI